MPGIHADNLVDRFLPTLGMHPIMLPLLGCQRFEQRRDWLRGPRETARPICGDRASHNARSSPTNSDRRLQWEPPARPESYAKTDNDFRIGEMCEDLIDRPFVRSGTLAQFGLGQALDYPLEFLCCGRLNRQRLLTFDVGCYRLRVLLCCFVHRYGQRTANATLGLCESCGQINGQPGRGARHQQRLALVAGQME